MHIYMYIQILCVACCISLRFNALGESIKLSLLPH